MANGVSALSRRSPLPVIATALTVAMVLSGCGLLGGSSSEGGESGKSGKGLETIKVSIMKTTDLAPFHIARTKGFFKKEGLNVDFVNAPSGSGSANKLISGEADIAYSSYTPFMNLQSKGVAESKGGIKLVADASSASPGSSVVVATPSSPVDSVNDMAGKKVAVTATGTISHLLVLSTLKTNDVSYKNIKWVATPFPAVAQALKTDRVDAAFATEPFIQAAMKTAGARPIFDTAVGPTADLPLAGYASTGDYVKENQKTVAAFQRAMQRATNLAQSDRNLVNKMLVKYSGVDKKTAKLARLLAFQSKLDASRIQRVPDLMLEFDVLKKRVSAKQMIVPTAPLK